MGVIYMFTNLINLKRYVGKWSGDIMKRYRDHINGRGSIPLKRAIDKYGIHHFSFDILHENIPHEFLSYLETQEIAKYNCNASRSGGHGYNLTDGGDGML